MSDWTDADTDALAVVAGDVERHCDFPDVGEDALLTRAGDEIRRLQARVEELRAGADGLVVSYQRRIAYQVGVIADLSRRLDTLEAERAEVAKDLRDSLHTVPLADTGDFDEITTLTAEQVRKLAARLERKGEPGTISEMETVDAIPRATLVIALRERIEDCRITQASPCFQVWLDVRESLRAWVDEIESGEWPAEHEETE